MARTNTAGRAAADERAPKPPVSQQAAVTDNSDIARRAYELYLARGCQHGHDLEDWVQAERELRAS
jgi:hypothetical protein